MSKRKTHTATLIPDTSLPPLYSTFRLLLVVRQTLPYYASQSTICFEQQCVAVPQTTTCGCVTNLPGTNATLCTVSQNTTTPILPSSVFPLKQHSPSPLSTSNNLGPPPHIAIKSISVKDKYTRIIARFQSNTPRCLHHDLGNGENGGLCKANTIVTMHMATFINV